MIAAVSTVRNEADIIEASVRCLLAGGVDKLLIADASTDGTTDILRRLERETGRVTRLVDDEPVHRQPYWIDYLAAEAGTEWILPFDADEFWFATGGKPIAQALALGVGGKLYAQLWHHQTWELKYAAPERLPKVAYRWTEEAHIAPGNHDVSLPGGTWGLLEVRHYQFRGFEHFKRKVRERCATLDPVGRARGDGAHMTRLDGSGDEELRAAWNEMQAAEVVRDPIPFHGRHSLDS